MVAYWDSEQRCRFSNEAYREWFGRSPAEMVGMHMKELLGPLYEMNLGYIAVSYTHLDVYKRQVLASPNLLV